MIIGGGPAGLTAAIYARRAGLLTAVMERLYEGGQLASIHTVDNYPGFYGMSGDELIEKMSSHARVYDYGSINDEATGIEENGGIFTIKTGSSAYSAKTVIIASGASPKKLNVRGEDIFTGRGVSYCAVCDGAFFKGKDAAVIGGGNTAAQDALYLARICRRVYMIHRRNRLRAERHFTGLIEQNPAVELIYDAIPDEIYGNESVESLRISGVKTGNKRSLDVSGVFIAVGISPGSGFARGFTELDESGFIKTDEYMRTNVPGVFAAGDVRTSPLRQIITATADGAVAADSARAYLER